MKYKSLITLTSSFFMVLVLATPSFAQTGAETWIAEGYGHFLISVIAGVLLAFAFHFLLTNLAVASGITAVGNVQDKFNDSRYSSSHSDNEDTRDSDDTPTGVKISSGVGLYLVLTMTISLFFASLIAVKLTLTADNTIGFTVGLVIWAGYLLLVLYAESKMLGSLTGSIFSAAKDVLSAGSSAVGSMFSSSEGSRMKDTAEETIKAISDEIRQEFDTSDIQNKLDEYVNKLEPQKLNMDDMKEGLAQLIQEIEVKEEYDTDDSDTIKHMFLEVASEQPAISDKDKEKLKSVFDQAKEIHQSNGSKTDKAMSAVDRMAPGDEEEGKKYRQKVEQYLRETDHEELNPDKLKDDLDEILNDPQTTPQVLEERINKFDRSTLTSLISGIEGINDEKADEYVSKAEQALEMIKSKAKDFTSNGTDPARQTSDSKGKGDAKKAIKQWFDRMDQPELRYDNLRHDVKRILDDPKTTPSILKKRLKRMDRESLIALMSNNKRVDREQAEKVVDKIEQGRDEVLNKMNEIEKELKEKTEKVKQESMRQVEAARKTAAAAAWWLFLATVLSGGASALGGILAFTI